MNEQVDSYAIHFFDAQGHVRKLAALLHVPRAASRGRWLFPTRLQ